MFVRRLSALAIAASLATAAWADQQPDFLIGTEDTSKVSEFTLSFPDLGFNSGALIANTDLILQLDGTSGNFLSYYQNVGALELPTPAGPVSTGAITVEILDSLGGTFDPATGAFETTDLYAVYFAGDLSAFGISSPFLLQSTTTGTVNTDGTISMQWAGSGTIGDGPAALPFIYTCSVNVVYVEGCPGDLDNDGQTSFGDFAKLSASWGVDDGGDINGDGETDFDDFAILSASWGCGQ